MIERTDARFGLRPTTLIGDTAYGAGRMLGWLVANAITPHVPVREGANKGEGIIPETAFSFDPGCDDYTCPEGKRLTSTGQVYNRRISYRASKFDCEICPLKSNCCPTQPYRKLTRDVARALAARLRWRWEDVDDLIEKRERTTIADLFAQQGEAYFRGVERDILRLVQPLRHAVIATGGGTFADAENRTLINMDGVSVWIDVPLADITPRIPLDGRRPLAADRAQLERLYHARIDCYRLAHVRVSGSRVSTSAIVDRIIEAVHELPPLVDHPPPR
jgi:shikimate kinase